MHSPQDDPCGPGCPIQTSRDHCPVTGSLWLFAGSHVFHRLLTPRHPPCALSGLIAPTARRDLPGEFLAALLPVNPLPLFALFPSRSIQAIRGDPSAIASPRSSTLLLTLGSHPPRDGKTQRDRSHAFTPVADPVLIPRRTVQLQISGCQRGWRRGRHGRVRRPERAGRAGSDALVRSGIDECTDPPGVVKASQRCPHIPLPRLGTAGGNPPREGPGGPSPGPRQGLTPGAGPPTRERRVVRPLPINSCNSWA